MKQLFVFVLAVILVACGEKAPTNPEAPSTPAAKAPEVKQKKNTAQDVRDIAKANPKVVRVDLTSIRGNGRSAVDLYGDYLGLQGKIPETASIDFGQNLAELWAFKVSRKSISGATLANAEPIVRKYVEGDKSQKNISQLILGVDAEVQKAKQSIDWDKLCKAQGMSEKKCLLAKSLVNSLRGRDLLAYGMTELLPSADGSFNVRYLDILVQNAGVEYLNALPAVYDSMLSFGIYQFTSYALADDGVTIGGASIVNRNLKKGAPGIPGSVVKLQGDEHHRAALFFAAYNIIKMTKFLSEKSAANFQKNYRMYHSEIVIHIAASHHAPAIAQRRTANWINSGMKKSLLESYGKHRIRAYAIKTRANLAAIYKS